ncbi:hypothetical protein LEP1GSC083_1886 [Leptospira interrogans serovar Pyrogenes str. L0374]|uniref:Uncharacterized protein n=6 Tax=Leptospira interrogans TaxID=173 RepID=M6ZRX6_LEPIR|nr:hypothetical protein LIL_11895 [Leptospira interrogans serovar Linhai str. 56609]EKO08426.1 hypothetical protein LEP1GSC077_1568 [Leptospira interrogans str. C10069]EKO24100.1 hypothetical protein LEP1GSC104_2443 [Leptospira interrogans str. UI 12621]EMN30068.1 hypothetical protein LEP1GSC083_1886 [Leptospira interrogans serovar Pyrogenes str. L0374]EMN60633.1 hypothetical protein LEP1GSC092_1741 [Leptospira interrogans serovar Pyrogenes str. R168]EMN68013.1 hypothetical protein LEP1GSC098_
MIDCQRNRVIASVVVSVNLRFMDRDTIVSDKLKQTASITLELVPKPSNVGTYCKNLTTLELLESSQIAKCNLKCRNYCILLEISKELSCKFFEVLGQAFNTRRFELKIYFWNQCLLFDRSRLQTEKRSKFLSLGKRNSPWFLWRCKHKGPKFRNGLVFRNLPFIF